MKNVTEAMYLGNKLNRKASIQEEIRHQMQQVTITWKRLEVYWKATNASKKWQLLADDTIVFSRTQKGIEEILGLIQDISSKSGYTKRTMP
jgi:hypothetical protein